MSSTGGILVSKSKQVKQSVRTTVHGNSKLLVPHSAECLASAEFMNFAPYPCVCCSCFPSKAQKKRVYARVYENKVEINNCPCAPWLCCTPEGCINDFIYTKYYSHPPFRVGMCPYPLCCIPCVCCGPPVIFIRHPTFCCCIDCRPCCGETIFSSPANCFDLKCCLCCGNPCHMTCCSRPLVLNVRNGRLFLSHMKAATQEYHAKHGFSVRGQASQNVVYREVVDRGDCCCGCCSTTRDIEAWVEPNDYMKAPLAEEMDRASETMEASGTTASTVTFADSNPSGGNVVMAAAIPVPIPVPMDRDRQKSEDSDDQRRSTQKYSNLDDEDDIFDDMAKQYQPPPSSGKEVEMMKRSNATKPQKERRSVSRSRQAAKQREEEEPARRPQASQLNETPSKRNSFDTWGGSSDSFADSGHFDDSMFQNVALDSCALENSGPFSESSTLERSGAGLGDSSTLESSGRVGDSHEPTLRKKKKKKRSSSNRHSSMPREGGERASSSRPEEGGEHKSSRHRDEGRERRSSRPREGEDRKSSRQRDDGAHHVSGRHREDGEPRKHRESRTRDSSNAEDVEKKKKHKKKSGSSRPRSAHYSAGVDFNQMERE